jgi:hypothetical protein
VPLLKGRLTCSRRWLRSSGQAAPTQILLKVARYFGCGRKMLCCSNSTSQDARAYLGGLCRGGRGGRMGSDAVLRLGGLGLRSCACDCGRLFYDREIVCVRAGCGLGHAHTIPQTLNCVTAAPACMRQRGVKHDLHQTSKLDSDGAAQAGSTARSAALTRGWWPSGAPRSPRSAPRTRGACRRRRRRLRGRPGGCGGGGWREMGM